MIKFALQSLIIISRAGSYQSEMGPMYVSFSHASTARRSSNGAPQIVFLVLTGVGVLIPLLMAEPSKMVRVDGTRVTTPQHPSWKTEFMGLWIAIRTDPWIVLLFPMFFASNWFYTWRAPVLVVSRDHLLTIETEFNDYNGAIFNIRARSLNNLVYWLAQIVGSVSIGFLLDQRGLSRRLRAFSGWCVLLVMVFVVHIWAYFYQRCVRHSLALTCLLGF